MASLLRRTLLVRALLSDRPPCLPAGSKLFQTGGVSSATAAMTTTATLVPKQGLNAGLGGQRLDACLGQARRVHGATHSPGEGALCTRLSGRGLVRLAGPDAVTLLQGLVTNDTGLMWGQSRAMYTMFLNTQGRVLFDVLCYRVSGDASQNPSFLLECDATVQAQLIRHLKMFRIRKKVDISSMDDQLQAWALFNAGGEGSAASPLDRETTDGDKINADDPRVEGFGRRILLPKKESVTSLVPESTEVGQEAYTLHRYRWGVPEGVADLPLGDSLPLESNLAYMNGVSFTKGCYLGQELTARTHHTGVIRKRIMPVHIQSHSASPPEAGAKVISEEGRSVGKLRSFLGNHGLALLRVAKCKDKQLLIIGQDGSRTELEATVPSWWPPEEGDSRTQ